MQSLSTVASAAQASATLSIDAQFKKMRAEGIDVVGFGAGEPDFDTPEHIKQAAIRAIEQNKTRYTPASGLAELKQAVCFRMREDLGLRYEPGNVFIASGAKHCVYLALMALLNPGDEVILPSPYWVSYIEMVRMAYGVPVVVRTTEQTHLKMTADQLEAAITPKTKCLILNNPGNPTGMVYSEQELRDIAAVCLKHQIYVIADEIYYSLVYDGTPFTSFAALGDEIRELTIVVNGVSKSYAMTGWRIGYTMANRQITDVMSRFVSHSTGAPATFAQWGAVEALMGPQDTVEQMRQAFEQRRNYLVERMQAIPGVSCLKPQGAFYVMMNLHELIGKQLYGETITDADSFARLFLDYGLVSVVPGTAFDAPEHVRWSYATSMQNITAGLDRLEKFLKG